MKNDKRKVFYEVDPRYFKDGTGEGRGDLKGLYNNMEYIANLGVDVLIIQNILSSLTDEDSQNFTGISKELGEVNMLKSIISIGKVNNIDVVIELPIATIKENHTWFKSAEAQNNSDFTEIVKLYSKRKVEKETEGFKYSEQAKGFYSIDETTQEIPLNWKSEQVLNQFKEVIRYWRDLGVSGFIFKEFEYLTDDRREEFMSRTTLRELRKLYRAVKEIDDRLYSIGKSITLNPAEVKKYTSGSTKVFDYFISENISLLGASKKHGTDLIGKFRTRELASLIKTYSKNRNHILGFGSELIGRVNSRWGDHGQYWSESAKSIALILMMNPASPLIYFADEIGTLNIGLTHLDDFMDETLEERKKLAMAEGVKEDKFMDAQVLQNPINAHSSMAWSDEEHAGFTWAEKIASPVPYTYREINVSKQYSDEESVLNFYKTLAKFIKKGKYADIIAKGKFSITSLIPGLFRIVSTLGDKELVTYVNLTDKSKKIRKFKEGKIIFTTYSHKKYKELPLVLGAFESIVVTKDTDEAIRNTQLIALGKIKEVEAREKAKQQKILEKKKHEEEKVQRELNKLEKERTEKLRKVTKVSEAKKAQTEAENKAKREESKQTNTREIKARRNTQTIKVGAAKKTNTQTIKVAAKRTNTQTIKVNAAKKKTNTQTIKVAAAKKTNTQSIKVDGVKKNKTQTLKVKDDQENTSSFSFSLSNIFKKDAAKVAVNPEETITFKIGEALNKVTSIFKKEPLPQTPKAQKAIEANEKAREAYNVKLVNAKPEEVQSIKEQERTRQFEFRETLKQEREVEKTKEVALRQKEILTNEKAHKAFETKLQKAKPEQVEVLKEQERTRQFEFRQAYKEERAKERQREHELRIKAKEEARTARDHERTQMFELRQKAREDRMAEKAKLFEEKQKEREAARKLREAQEKKEAKTKSEQNNNNSEKKTKVNNTKEFKVKEQKKTREFEVKEKAKEKNKVEEFELRQKAMNEAKEARELEKTRQFELKQKAKQEAREAKELEKTRQFELKQKLKEDRLAVKQKAREDAMNAEKKAREEKAKADAQAAKAKEKAREAEERAKIEATKTKEIELKAAKLAEEKAKLEAQKSAEREAVAKAKAAEELKKLKQAEKELAAKEAMQKAKQDKIEKEAAERKAEAQREKEVQAEVRRQEAAEEAERVEKAKREAKEAEEKVKEEAKIAKLKAKQDALNAKSNAKKAKAEAKEKAKLEKELKKKLAAEQKLNKAQEKAKANNAKAEKSKAMKLAKAKSKVEVDNAVLETEFTEDDMTSLLEEDLAGTTQIDMDDVDSFISMNKKKK